MGGIFSKAARPKRPGAYFNWESVQPVAIPVSPGAVVALGFTHVWGPDNTVVACGSYSEWLNTFGGDPNDPSAGYKAAKQAFQGEGYDGRGGAGQVLAYRMVGSAGAVATRNLANTTPATALRVDAVYKGTKGNDLKVTVQTNADDATKCDLIVLDGTTELETYTFLKTDTVAGAAALEASDWVRGTSVITGVALANVSAVALTGGNDGSTLIASDYTDALDAFDPERFGILVFENLTDDGIITTTAAWAIARNAAGSRFFLIVGGAADETIGDANDRSDDLNNWDILNVGLGHVEDSSLLDENGDPVSLSPAELAPRVAGVLARRGEKSAITSAHLFGLKLVGGATTSDALSAYDHGTIVLSLSSHPTAPVKIEKGLTTYTGGDDTKDAAIYSRPKYVATEHAIDFELTSYADVQVGEVPVDNETRAAVLAEIGRVMSRRVNDKIIQAGWTAIVDPDPAPSDDDEFVAFVISGKFTRSAEQFFFTGRLG